MEAPPSPTSSSSLSALRDRLRATMCCCFGGGGGGGLGGRMRWRGRAGVGEFRYDPLSYALNFDEGDLLDADADDDDLYEAHAGRGGGGMLYQSFSSRLPAPAAAIEVA